jgi:hypothetical protein
MKVSGQLHASWKKAPVHFRKGAEQTPDVISSYEEQKSLASAEDQSRFLGVPAFGLIGSAYKKFYRKIIRQLVTQRCSWECDITGVLISP